MQTFRISFAINKFFIALETAGCPGKYFEGLILLLYREMAITPKNNDPKEPKLCDFSYISMTNPPIPFLGFIMAKKGFL